MDAAEIISKINPSYREPIWEHSLIYDSSFEQLEPIYFWLIDFMSDLGFTTEKIIDNFSASPGSGHFAELGARATKMQDEGMKIMQTIGVMLKSLVNLVYDLKEFEIRLKQYELAKSKNINDKESGLLGLKQLWMDKVDLTQRGRGSINAMAQEIGFTTLRDAFMVAKSIDEVDKLDLNDRVKRVLKPRLAEFFEWKERSESELRKRFEIEKSWAKSQVASLKLYARWAKPYLRAAEELMIKEKVHEPALVKAFNTTILELSLFGKSEVKVDKEVDSRNLPSTFKKIKFKRKYYACVFLDFKFRGIPTRTPQGGYAFGGRSEIAFKAFALNEDEIKALNKEIEKEDFSDAFKLVEIMTEESLSQMLTDLEHFIGGEKQDEKKEGKKDEKKKEASGKIKKDGFEESLVRTLAERTAADLCSKIYDTYKKAHGMASFVLPGEEEWKLAQKQNFFKPRKEERKPPEK